VIERFRVVDNRRLGLTPPDEVAVAREVVRPRYEDRVVEHFRSREVALERTSDDANAEIAERPTCRRGFSGAPEADRMIVGARADDFQHP